MMWTLFVVGGNVARLFSSAACCFVEASFAIIVSIKALGNLSDLWRGFFGAIHVCLSAKSSANGKGSMLPCCRRLRG